MSHDLVCGLANWSGWNNLLEVKCWDLATREALPSLPVVAPLQVAVSERVVCVREMDRLRCWEYLGQKPELKKWFSNFTRPTLLTGGPGGNFCAYDPSWGFGCSHLVTPARAWAEPFALALGSAGQVCALQRGSRRPIDCVVGEDTEATCRENLAKIYFEDRYARQIFTPRGPQPDCQACVLSPTGPHCWGDGHEPRDQRPIAPRFPTHLAFLRVPRFAADRDVPCVLAKQKIYCSRRRDSFEEVSLLPADDGEWIALDGQGERYCALTDESWVCSLDGKIQRIHHGLALRFTPEKVAQTFRDLSAHMYRAQGKLLVALAEALNAQGNTPELGAFTLLAGAPVIDAVDSEYFAAVKAKLHESIGQKKLADCPRSPGTIAIALAGVHAALESLGSERFAPMLVALGNAMVAPGELGALRAEFEKVKSEVPVERADGGLLMALMEYLRP